MRIGLDLRDIRIQHYAPSESQYMMINDPVNELPLTQDDADLFAIDDLALRAKALRYDVLPRMDQILRKGVDLIREIYDDDAFEYSSIVRSPGFRENRRVEDVKYEYMECRVGLGGKRSDLWEGLEKVDGNPPTVLPVRLWITLDSYGASVMLILGGHSLSKGSWARMLAFFTQHWSNISAMGMGMHWGMQHHIYAMGGAYVDHVEYLTREFLDEEDPFLQFGNWSIELPVEGEALTDLVDDFAFLWPLYHSIIRISMGKEPMFHEKVDQLNRFLAERLNTRTEEIEQPSASPDPEHLASVMKRAKAKVPVMPALRFRVLARDGWKCVSCGKSAEDDVVLHVDHILPRSKGGADEFDNYQTLCHTCNLGKGDRDSTDIRATRHGA